MEVWNFSTNYCQRFCAQNSTLVIILKSSDEYLKVDCYGSKTEKNTERCEKVKYGRSGLKWFLKMHSDIFLSVYSHRLIWFQSKIHIDSIKLKQIHIKT